MVSFSINQSVATQIFGTCTILITITHDTFQNWAFVSCIPGIDINLINASCSYSSIWSKINCSKGSSALEIWFIYPAIILRCHELRNKSGLYSEGYNFVLFIWHTYILKPGAASNYWWIALLKMKRNKCTKQKENHYFLLKCQGEDESSEQTQRLALPKEPWEWELQILSNFKGISLVSFETLLPN